MTTTTTCLLCLCLVSSPAWATDPPRQTGAIRLGQDTFKPSPQGPTQGFRKDPAPPSQPSLRPMVDPEVDGIVGLVSFEQLRDIIQRTEAPEDRRMLQRAFDKLLLLERDRRTYATSINLILEGCGRMMDRKSTP